MATLPATTPSRPTLRKLLASLFLLDSDLDAFIVDCFPWVKQRMAAGPDRTARVNLLFELVPTEELWATLCQHYASELASEERLLTDESRQSAAIREREALHRELADLQRVLAKCRILENPTDKIEARMLELRRTLRRGRQVVEQMILLNRYRMMEQLGKGGFSTVWQARDCGLEADSGGEEIVAVKVMLGHHQDNAAILRRFQRGARLMQDLQHPHVARVLAGPHEDEDLHFFVMEYLSGGDLQQAVEQQRFSPPQIVEIILQIGSALQHAHERGHVHRDVTPANILLDYDGRAKLTDFDLVLPKDTSTVAGVGAQGTLNFAPPEQLDGTLSDVFEPRIDVYSLGMTMLFGLTGQAIPIVRREKLLPQILANLPFGPSLRTVMQRALAESIDDRYQTVAELCSALQGAWARYTEAIELATTEAVEVAAETPIGSAGARGPSPLRAPPPPLPSLTPTRPLNLTSREFRLAGAAMSVKAATASLVEETRPAGLAFHAISTAMDSPAQGARSSFASSPAMAGAISHGRLIWIMGLALTTTLGSIGIFKALQGSNNQPRALLDSRKPDLSYAPNPVIATPAAQPAEAVAVTLDMATGIDKPTTTVPPANPPKALSQKAVDRLPDLDSPPTPLPKAASKPKPEPKDELLSLLDAASSRSSGKPFRVKKEEIPKQLLTSEVQRTLKGVDISSCRNQAPYGVVMVKLTIGQSGSVLNATPSNDRGRVADCVADKVRSAKFNKFSGDPMVFSFPFLVL